jgi:catechol 2,3-dioxygenase-like lactoylglutathione lyase family enzyme
MMAAWKSQGARGSAGGRLILGGLHHISIAVDDLERARAFYGGVLGLAEIPRPALPNPGWWFQAGGCQLHLTVRPEEERGRRIPATGAGETHFAFASDDLDQVKKHLEGRGVQVKDGVNARLGMRQLFFRDPSGNLVEVFCVLAG